MWIYGVKSLRFLDVNEAAVAHYGYSRDEFLRMTIRDIRPPEDIPALEREVAQLDSGTQSLGVWRHLKRDGSLIEVEVLGTEIDFNEHRARLVLAHDVTDRLRIERRLRTGFEVTRVLADAPSFGEASPLLLQAMCEGSGWEYGEIWRVTGEREPLRWDGCWHSSGPMLDDFAQATRTLTLHRGDGLAGAAWATGQPQWLSDLPSRTEFFRHSEAARLGLRQGFAMPVKGRTNHVLGVMVFFSRTARDPDEDFLDLMADLGERIGQYLESENAEVERRRLEERFTNAFHHSPMPAVISRISDGSLIDVNESFLRAFEYERNQVIGKTSIALGMWANPADREHVLTPVHRGESVRGTEATFRSKSGRTWNALVFSEPITLEAEPSILSSLVDVTDLRAAQQRILEMERLSSIGQTAAFVAHEINTPLTNIALLASNIRRQTEDPAILQRAEKIETQRKVASRIIDEVLTLSRAPEIRREGTDLNALVRTAAEQADTYRKPEVVLNLDLVEGPIAAWVDPLRMAQVFVNLIKNAFQATDHGTVTVSLRTEGRTAVVTVQDTGPGMTEGVQARLFQPFFTTKARGEGVGLGLVFVRSVVNAHGGTLELASEPGKGTTCTLRLPVDAPAG